MRYKRGSADTGKFYQVLAFFTQYYKKWFVSTEDEFAWAKNASNKSNLKLLVSLITRTGGAFLDVRLDKDEDRGPQHVFNYCGL